MAAKEGKGKTAQQWAFEIMNKPFGRWLVGAGRLFFCGIGCYYLYRAIKAEFRKRFKMHSMRLRKLGLTIAGQVGIAARGMVYIVIGFIAYGIRMGFQARYRSIDPL